MAIVSATTKAILGGGVAAPFAINDDDLSPPAVNSCEIPSVSIDSLTVAEFVRDYYSISQPVRLTSGHGGTSKSGEDQIAEHFPDFSALDIFLKEHGHLIAAGGEIPYGENFGNKNHQSRPLRDFFSLEQGDAGESRARIAFDALLVSQHPKLQVLQNAAPPFATRLCHQRSASGLQLSLGPKGSGAPPFNCVEHASFWTEAMDPLSA
jgi:hypothetical protein